MILVTGATGTIGSNVTRILADRGVPYRAMSRTPGDLRNGVRADYTDPHSLAEAVAGVDAVFLVTVPDRPTPDHDEALLTAATKAGVSTVVRLSAIGSGEQFEGATVGAWHRAAEQAVEDSGLAWTILRPTSFASNFLWYLPLLHQGNPIPDLLGEAGQGVITPDDVAEVAVAALTDDTHHGQYYDLTGPELLTFAEQAAIIERVTGRPVKTFAQELSAAREQLKAGMTEEAADAMLTGVGWARAGRASRLSPHVARILNRPATSFEQWARDHSAAFEAIG
jgi:uncharacterized protein YbjT (DUF2867 family)